MKGRGASKQDVQFLLPYWKISRIYFKKKDMLIVTMEKTDALYLQVSRCLPITS